MFSGRACAGYQAKLNSATPTLGTGACSRHKKEDSILGTWVLSVHEEENMRSGRWALSGSEEEDMYFGHEEEDKCSRCWGML